MQLITNEILDFSASCVDRITRVHILGTTEL